MHARNVAALLACFACLIVGLVTWTQPAQAAIGAPVDLGDSEANSISCCSLTMGTSASVPAGASVIVTSLATASGSPTAATCSDSAGNSYATDAVRTSTNRATAICSTHQIGAALPSGSTVTVAWTGGTPGFTYRMRAFAVTGLAAAPFDRTASAEGTSSAPSSGAAAVTIQPDELLVGAIGDFDEGAAAAGFAPGANGTASNCAATGTPNYAALAGVGGFGVSLFTIHCAVNATGSYAAQGSFGTNPFWHALLATYRAAPTVNPPGPGGSSGGSTQPTAKPDCSKLLAKLNRQKRRLRRATGAAKRAAIERNLKETRDRLLSRGC